MLTTKPRLPIEQILLHGWLPSALKKILYRLKGYQIGCGVTLGFGSVLVGQDVRIGDYSQIGFLTVVRGRTIHIGKHVQIGAMSMLDTPHLEIGDGSKINEQVFVGGLQSPNSRFVVGRNCQIQQYTFINPARSIVVGDDTGIGGHCLIFGHASWLSRFEGYPVNFDSIEIGSSVGIAWRVFIGPGARIGEGTMVGANSLVTHVIPPRCLAMGSPARVVAKAPYLPRTVSPEEKISMLREIVAEMLGYFEGSELQCQREGELIAVTQNRRRWFGTGHQTWRLRVMYDATSLEMVRSLARDVNVLVSLRRLANESRAFLSGRGVMWIDIEQKERSDTGNELGEEVALYLRRYGVRFFRVPCDGAAPSLDTASVGDTNHPAKTAPQKKGIS